MAQDRGRWSEYGREGRGEYESNDARFRGRPSGQGRERGYESGRGSGQQRGEAATRSGWSGESTSGHTGSGQQSGDWLGSDYASRGYGQGGYGAQEERYRGDYGSQVSGGDGDYLGSGSFGERTRGYGQRSGSYANSRQGGSYGGGQRDREDHERGFMDKAGDEVASWFGDEEAEQRRRQDQHRGRGPRGYARSDDRIREDVNDRLTDDGMLDASDIDVQVSDREVTLTGEVSSRADKRRAEDIAEDVSGVSHVQNNLRVRKTGESGGVTGVTL